MSTRSKRFSAYYKFIAPYLEKGISEEIAEAKRNYRRQYKAAWRKANRKENKAITVQWSKEEIKTLSDEAKRHKQSTTRFIKESTLAYINKRYVVPNPTEVNKILQLLAMSYNTIENIANENPIDFKKMKEEILQLEHELRITFLSPKTLEQIIEEQARKNPEIIQKLNTILATIIK